MSDRELRSWSAGDPEPPEDVVELADPDGYTLERSVRSPKFWHYADSEASFVWAELHEFDIEWPVVEVLPETPTPPAQRFTDSAGELYVADVHGELLDIEEVTAEETSSPDPNMIYAPWDVKTALALNDFQQRREMHPFTCPREHEPDGSRVLVAGNGGWFCPDDDYTQNWAHAFMADRRFMAEPAAPETATPKTCAFPGCSRWAKEPDGLCDNIHHADGIPVEVITEHRNGCKGCDHDPAAYPPCWTLDQIDVDQGAIYETATGPSVSVVQDDTPATHEVDQAQVDQVNKVLADLRGEVHGLRSCVENLKDLYNLGPGVTTEILEHVALQQQKQLTAALALVEEMSLHLRQDVALSLGVESRLAELREGVQG